LKPSVASFLSSALLCVLSATATSQAEPHSLWDGNRTVPVHRFPVFDEDRQIVVPTIPGSMPMSARHTCGTCHAYETVSRGFHFNSSRTDARHGRVGEPWVWVDRLTGTALPVSERPATGVWSIGDLGITPRRFTQLFGHHLPGGDLAEPDDILAEPDSRWMVSGAVEINCMGCHNQSSEQDMSEWAKQMGRENFRWAATAASGMGRVNGMATRVPDSWRPDLGPNPDDRFWRAPPAVDYNVAGFSPSRAYFFDIGRPLDRNCLQCHSSAAVDTPRWQHTQDVHTAAGLACVDCHRNGLDHDIVRGYESEAAERGDPSVAIFSCAGCHLGQGDDPALPARGGRYGAPRPEHKGMPPIHFEKLACTTCHSGQLTTDAPVAVRTSRANRLGIHGRAQWFTEAPAMDETVFVRGASGKIEPHRLIWPSFWVRIADGQTVPLTPDAIAPHANGILDAPFRARTALEVFSRFPDLSGPPLFGVDGVLYAVDPDDHLRIDDATTTGRFTGVYWAVKVDGRAEPLLAEFDPSPQQLDYDLMKYVRSLLHALDKWDEYNGTPVLIYKGRMLRREVDNSLAIEDAPADAPPAPNGGDGMLWAWRYRDGRIEPLVSDLAAHSIRRTVGTERSFTEDQVAAVLQRLARAQPEAAFGYVAGGKLFRLVAGDRSLEAVDNPIAQPITWALGHDVRPTEQSLGARGCTDCHAADAPFFFAEASGRGPMMTQQAAVLPLHEFQQVDENFQALFGRSFQVRQTFKLIGTAASFLLGAILLVFALAGLSRLTRWIGRGRV
jgi:hypothetical protein